MRGTIHTKMLAAVAATASVAAACGGDDEGGGGAATEVTPRALIEQLDTIADLDVGGLVPPITVQELDDPAFRRWMSPYVIAYQIHDGVPVRFIDDFVDLRPAIGG